MLKSDLSRQEVIPAFLMEQLLKVFRTLGVVRLIIVMVVVAQVLAIVNQIFLFLLFETFLAFFVPFYKRKSPQTGFFYVFGVIKLMLLHVKSLLLKYIELYTHEIYLLSHLSALAPL